MANTIKIKNSGTTANVPSAASLQYGELALNYIDGKLYFKTGTSTVDFLKSNITLGTDTSGNYMSGISGTSPVSVSHSPAEGSSATVSLASGYGDTLNPYASKTASFVLSAPSGAAGVPTFRALVNGDIPSALTGKTYNGLTVTTSTGTLTVTNLKTLSVSNTLTLAGTDGTTMTFPATSSTVMTLANPGTLTGSLTLRAGTATAGTAPLYLTSGTNLTTAAAGAMEFDGTNLYFSPSTTRKTVAFTDSAMTSSHFIGTTSVALNRASGALTLAGITLTTPVLGVATATSINGLTITSSTGTLTVANLKTLSVSNTLTFTGTDASSVAFGAGGTVAYTNVTSLSSLATVGTITSGTWSGSFGAVSGANLTTLNASNLSSGTVASARISGSYTGITAIGTVASLTVDGASSASFTLGDWPGNGSYGGVVGNMGYMLIGNNSGDANLYFRATGSTATVRIGSNGADVAIIGNGTSVASNMIGLTTFDNIWNNSAGTATMTGYQYVVRSTSGFPAYYYFTSMREGKRNIETITDSGALIDQLNPVTYQAKIDETDDELSASWKDKDLEYGFIAEEVAEVGTGFLAQYMDDGEGNLKPAGWKFHGVVSVLVAEVKELRKRLAELEK
jgi:hypothetical protein